MNKPIHFLNMFPDYVPPESLKSVLTQAVLHAADIDPVGRKVSVDLCSAEYIPQRQLRQISGDIAATYGLREVALMAIHPVDQLEYIESEELVQLFVEQNSMTRGSLAGAQFSWEDQKLNIQLSANGNEETITDEQEKPPQAKFEPKKGKMRKPGTGCISKINDHLYEGRYSPKNAYGKRMARNIYAPTREECEEKLAILIKEMKAEIAEQKAKLKNA